MQINRGYARNGDVNIAYMVVGDGPIDLIWIPGFVSHIDMLWEDPLARPFFERLASFSRLIMFDKRGTGLSDRHSLDTTLDVRMDDVRVVLDATGSKRAVVAGQSEGGPMAIVFAATYPDRVTSLILVGTAPRWSGAPDYPGGAFLESRIDLGFALAEQSWGSGELITTMAPSMGWSPEVLEVMGRIERATASPSAVLATLRWVRNIDVRAVLPTLTVPTLILHRTDDVVIPNECAHCLRDNIPNARYVEQQTLDHIPWVGDTKPFLDEIEEFITGAKAEQTTDRILSTVLFTDIVDSTRHAAELGDRRWKDILERHDSLARAEVERFRGRLVKQTGDGLFASFDGPARGVQAARAIAAAVRPIGIEVRAGLHTGEVEVRGEDLGGIAVHIGARVSALAGANEILVSSTVKDLVAGSGLQFEDRGFCALKGIPDEWRLYAVAN